MSSLTRSMGAAAVFETMAAQPDRAKFSAKDNFFPDIFSKKGLFAENKASLVILNK